MLEIWTTGPSFGSLIEMHVKRDDAELVILPDTIWEMSIFINVLLALVETVDFV